MAFEDAYGEVSSTSVVKGFYDSVNADYLPVLADLLPSGPIWEVEEGSEMEGLLTALSYPLARVYERGQDLLEEYDPRTTFELLPDWERVLDLPGDNPSPPTTLATRRAAVHAKLLGHGDPTPAFFEQVALGTGYTATVKQKEYSPFVAGSPVGDPLTNGQWAFYWRLYTHIGLDDNLLEWIIDGLTPAHTGMDVIYYGETWTERSNPKNLDLFAVAHNGSDLWCAVGTADGGDTYIITSPDGITWTERVCPGATVGLKGVAYNGSNLWCAVGTNDGTDALIVTSPDGITWTERSNPRNLALNNVAYNGSDLWCAVGRVDGTDAYIVTSPDGITWTERSNPKNVILWGIAYNGSNLWVAVGSADGTDAYIVTSPDGITWTERSNPKNFTLSGVAYNGSNLWCAVGVADGTDAYIITSPDGITWTERSNPKNYILQDVTHNGSGLWIASGNSDGTNSYIVTSLDGITWVEQDPTVSKTITLFGIHYSQGNVVAVGLADGTDAYILTSGVSP